jgi:hypothetical protein
MANIARIPEVPACPCRVAFTDTNGIERSVQVVGNSLFEAVALGLRQMRVDSWAGELPDGLNKIRVTRLNPGQEYITTMKDFEIWLNKTESHQATSSNETGFERF